MNVRPEIERDTGLAVYVYGVMRAADVDEAPHVPGLDKRYPVRLHRVGELVAIVGEVDLAEFDGETLRSNLQNREWLEEKVWAHERVLEAALSTAAVLPMRFGSVYRADRGVEAFLEANAEAFATSLDRLDGRAEWGVKVYGTSADQDAPAADKSSGRAYLVARKAALDALRAHDAAQAAAAEQVLAELAALADAHQVGGAARATKPSAALLLNAAFLLQDTDRQRFLDAVGSLEARFASSGLLFEVSGPWPPYNFTDGGEHGDR
jgi:hypothetical protein